MFNETTYPTCTSDQLLTQLRSGRWACLTQKEWERIAVAEAAKGSEAVSVTPKSEDAWTNWAIYGGIGLVLLAIVTRGGR